MKKKVIVMFLLSFLVLLALVVSFFLGGAWKKKDIEIKADDNAKEKWFCQNEYEVPSGFSGEVKSVLKGELVILEDTGTENKVERVVLISKDTKISIKKKRSEAELATGQKLIQEQSASLQDKLKENEKVFINCPSIAPMNIPLVVSSSTNIAPPDSSNESEECKRIKKEHQELVDQLNDIYLKNGLEYETLPASDTSDVRVGDKANILLVYSDEEFRVEYRDGGCQVKAATAELVDVWK
jgi:hypothetical protein